MYVIKLYICLPTGLESVEEEEKHIQQKREQYSVNNDGEDQGTFSYLPMYDQACDEYDNDDQGNLKLSASALIADQIFSALD